MDEHLRAFRDGVIVRAMAEFGGRDPEGGFGSVAGEMLEEAEELVDFVPCPYRGTGTRRRSLGIDGYAFDEADGSLRLVIAEFEGERQPATVTQTTAKATFSKVVAFVDEAFAGNDDHLPADEDPAADFSGLLQIHQPNITRLRFYLVTDGILSDRIRDWPEQSIGGIPAEFHIWDIARFHDALSSRSGREALTVDFGSLVAGGVPCLKASLNQSEYSGYLCVLPADALARMYEEYGSRLLEGNVRSFLGKAVKVNKAIRETVLRSPEMFFAFNNGIAATSTSVETRDTPEGPRLLAATDLQIVNGGQTTASLALARRKDGAELAGIFVQMKLSVVDAEKSGELIPKISEYANRQTKVSDSDLFSNHPFHRKLEELSRRIKAPPRAGSQRPTTWFYERAKGQYRIETSKMSPAEKLRFEADNPRRQVITKTDIAKIENSWRQLPHEVARAHRRTLTSTASLL
ncbi:MAG: AIPR family protein [Rubrivivax sp.]|nr:AIPR family protein [Rubrivivax sp.]